jgi:hypothetical protein
LTRILKRKFAINCINRKQENVTKNGWREYGVKHILKFSDCLKKIIGLTATTLPTLHAIYEKSNNFK